MSHSTDNQQVYITAGIANGPTSRGVQGGGGKLRGGLAGQRINLHRKKFHFCIIQTILNKISKNNFEKSLDLAIFVNFSDLPQGGGVGVVSPTPYGDPCITDRFIE